MQIYGKEGIFYIKESNSHRISLEHQYGRRFIVLEHQLGRRFIVLESSRFGREISIRSKTVYLAGFKCFVSGPSCTERDTLPA